MLKFNRHQYITGCGINIATSPMQPLDKLQHPQHMILFDHEHLLFKAMQELRTGQITRLPMTMLRSFYQRLMSFRENDSTPNYRTVTSFSTGELVQLAKFTENYRELCYLRIADPKKNTASTSIKFPYQQLIGYSMTSDGYFFLAHWDEDESLRLRLFDKDRGEVKTKKYSLLNLNDNEKISKITLAAMPNRSLAVLLLTQKNNKSRLAVIRLKSLDIQQTPIGMSVNAKIFPITDTLFSLETINHHFLVFGVSDKLCCEQHTEKEKKLNLIVRDKTVSQIVWRNEQFDVVEEPFVVPNFLPSDTKKILEDKYVELRSLMTETTHVDSLELTALIWLANIWKHPFSDAPDFLLKKTLNHLSALENEIKLSESDLLSRDSLKKFKAGERISYIVKYAYDEKLLKLAKDEHRYIFFTMLSNTKEDELKKMLSSFTEDKNSLQHKTNEFQNKLLYFIEDPSFVKDAILTQEKIDLFWHYHSRIKTCIIECIVKHEEVLTDQLILSIAQDKEKRDALLNHVGFHKKDLIINFKVPEKIHITQETTNDNVSPPAYTNAPEAPEAPVAPDAPEVPSSPTVVLTSNQHTVTPTQSPKKVNLLDEIKSGRGILKKSTDRPSSVKNTNLKEVKLSIQEIIIKTMNERSNALRSSGLLKKDSQKDKVCNETKEGTKEGEHKKTSDTVIKTNLFKLPSLAKSNSNSLPKQLETSLSKVSLQGGNIASTTSRSLVYNSNKSQIFTPVKMNSETPVQSKVLARCREIEMRKC